MSNQRYTNWEPIGKGASALDEIIIRLMSYDPNDRLNSTDDLLTILKTVPQPPWEIAAVTGDLEWITVPGGKFILGTSVSDPLAHPNEKPRREVVISSFQMTTYPITNLDYRKFIETTNYPKPACWDKPEFNKDDHPLVEISWDDAKAFARWLGGDLPTEAQWEYAARSCKRIAQGSVYPWGNESPTITRANINSFVSRSTSAVKAYPDGRNELGFYDLCGNVWEWCRDVWSDKYYSVITNGVIDPVNQETNENSDERSLRGACYDSLISQGRCTARFHDSKDSKMPWIGFRVVKPIA